jgi:hypothetical protein
VSAKQNPERGNRIGRVGVVGCALVALVGGVGVSACDRRVDLGAIGDGAASLLWSASFERGDLSEWTGDGQGSMFNDNIDGKYPVATTAVAHGGRYSGLLTLSPTAGMTSTNYLFRNEPSPQAAYYSAWFYVPSTTFVGTWLSLTHFRGSTTGDGNNLTGIWDVSLYPLPYNPYGPALAAQLFGYAGQKNQRQVTPVPIPYNTWFQLEVYFVKATDATGQIQLWQNGVLILEREGVPTVTNDWLQWDAGAACDALTLPPATVYMDDATISTVRVGVGS